MQERLGHCAAVLFFCEHARKLWEHDEVWGLIKALQLMPTLEIGLRVFQLIGRRWFEEWVTRVWMIWLNYCALTHDNGEARRNITQMSAGNL